MWTSCSRGAASAVCSDRLETQLTTSLPYFAPRNGHLENIFPKPPEILNIGNVGSSKLGISSQGMETRKQNRSFEMTSFICGMDIQQRWPVQPVNGKLLSPSDAKVLCACHFDTMSVIYHITTGYRAVHLPERRLPTGHLVRCAWGSRADFTVKK